MGYAVLREIPSRELDCVHLVLILSLGRLLSATYPYYYLVSYDEKADRDAGHVILLSTHEYKARRGAQKKCIEFHSIKASDIVPL